MARDYLAIQGSAAPSERVFSQGGITDTKRRNRLSPVVFEALQMLKAAYRNRHIQASEQALAYSNGPTAIETGPGDLGGFDSENDEENV
jgi:hypothetical protein